MKLITEGILVPLTLYVRQAADKFEAVKSVLALGDVKEISLLSDVLGHLGAGNCVLMIDGVAGALACSVPGWEDRAVEEPAEEQAIRGPRDSFTENLRTNTAMIRPYVNDPRLWIEELKKGASLKRKWRSSTSVALRGIPWSGRRDQGLGESM